MVDELVEDAFIIGLKINTNRIERFTMHLLKRNSVLERFAEYDIKDVRDFK